MVLSVNSPSFLFDRQQLWTLPAWMVFIQHILLLPFQISIPYQKELAKQQGGLHKPWGRSCRDK